MNLSAASDGYCGGGFKAIWMLGLFYMQIRNSVWRLRVTFMRENWESGRNELQLCASNTNRCPFLIQIRSTPSAKAREAHELKSDATAKRLILDPIFR